MAIQVNGTTVIDNSRALTNISSVDSTTVTALGNAGVGGVTVNVTTLSHPTVTTSDANTGTTSDYRSNYYTGTVVSGQPSYATTLRTFNFDGLVSATWNINSSTNYSTSTGPFFSSLNTLPGNAGYISVYYSIWYYDASANESTSLIWGDGTEQDGNANQYIVTSLRSKLGSWDMPLRACGNGDKLLLVLTNGYYWGGSATFKSTFATFTITEVT
jgi:hypothetical protein